MWIGYTSLNWPHVSASLFFPYPEAAVLTSVQSQNCCIPKEVHQYTVTSRQDSFDASVWTKQRTIERRMRMRIRKQKPRKKNTHQMPIKMQWNHKYCTHYRPIWYVCVRERERLCPISLAIFSYTHAYTLSTHTINWNECVSCTENIFMFHIFYDFQWKQSGQKCNKNVEYAPLSQQATACRWMHFAIHSLVNVRFYCCQCFQFEMIVSLCVCALRIVCVWVWFIYCERIMIITISYF